MDITASGLLDIISTVKGLKSKDKADDGQDHTDLSPPKQYTAGNSDSSDSEKSGGMPSYKKGGTVKNTGPAILHKGEYVIPAEKVKLVKNSPLSKSEKKSDAKKKKKHKLHITLHEADGGGLRADHRYEAHPEDESPVPGPEEHNLPTADAAGQHVSEAFAAQQPETEPDGDEAPPPAPTAGPAMPQVPSM